ncbi:MAG: trans-2-enoyl-CoA reductase family protein [Clostridiales bacterium]|jgi:enoyl-[acyl-carrier protein] reductase/trans-2-enoyl-CoA reductase (NAD+)|nr:trans-2-enoyl-CoA reductase family protein [Clostridiales bacterium]
MIIEPKIRGFLCLNAHPTGCAGLVASAVACADEYAARNAAHKPNIKNALVIGASTGYGLAARIALACGAGASTAGVFLERPATESRTASAGWYNSAAFADTMRARNVYAASLCGDAFDQGIKNKTVDLIKRDLGRVDAVIYSLAAPRRKMPDGTVYNSVLKTVGKEFCEKSLDMRGDALTAVTVPAASRDEIDATIKVMGGGDFAEWLYALRAADALAPDARAIAFSYIGPPFTAPVYYDGTIGLAKRDLELTAAKLRAEGINARVAVNSAAVTQASAAIPVVPLYISVLRKVMKEKRLHEAPAAQMCRLFFNSLDNFDSDGRIRLDNLELRPDVQAAVQKNWQNLTPDNLTSLADVDGFKKDFYNLFGFRLDSVDYSQPVDPLIPIAGLAAEDAVN